MPRMPIIVVLLILIVVGVVLYAINKDLLFPLDVRVKWLINVVVLLVTVVWLLQTFGMLDGSLITIRHK
jgi:hypothetical protein